MDTLIGLLLVVFLGYYSVALFRDSRKASQPQRWHLMLLAGVLFLMALGCLWWALKGLWVG